MLFHLVLLLPLLPLLLLRKGIFGRLLVVIITIITFFPSSFYPGSKFECVGCVIR